MIPAFLEQALTRVPEALAVAHGDNLATYRMLADIRRDWSARLRAAGAGPGSVVSIEGEYGPQAVGALLACLEANCILVPLSSDSRAHIPVFLPIAEVEFRLEPDRKTVAATSRAARHALFKELRRRGAAGLVLFSSGSTGTHKAAVHDFDVLLRKFATPRHRYRTLVFLQPDHIGGINTLLYTLANSGTVVIPEDRSCETVAAAIEKHRVELLPASPTFLNLLLLSGVTSRRDLSSLKLVTYGTEAMPASTLARLPRLLPNVRLQQTYGLTEIGILRSKSKGSDSLWIRVGGEGYETKVVDGRLWVRAESAMLGYLNAPSPFSPDGFFDTGDRVEVDGEWLRILGRDSDIINVGGSKVYPAEVESVLLQMSNVVDASVYAEPNSVTGQVVACTVRLAEEESLAAFKLRMRRHCERFLPPYKIPMKVALTREPLHSARFKRVRPSAAAAKV